MPNDVAVKQRALDYAEANARQYGKSNQAADALSTYGWVLYRLGRLDDAEKVLQNAGYLTQGAANGDAALQAYRDAFSRGQRFHLVILDLTVPGGMGGREAAEKILAIDPGARLMVSSGYSDDALMAEFWRYGFRAVLPKPYNAMQLCDAVQAVLQEDQASK